MAIQIIFCVETNKRAATDNIYIMEVLNSCYVIDNQVKISRVYMNTKTKYNSREVLREIEKNVRSFTIGESKVIYCIDTDDFEINYQHKKELDDISGFCQGKNYDLIWFCHDVEDVFLGKRVSDSEKVKEAGNFRRKKLVDTINRDDLSSTVKRKRTSNMMTVLDKYLKRR